MKSTDPLLAGDWSRVASVPRNGALARYSTLNDLQILRRLAHEPADALIVEWLAHHHDLGAVVFPWEFTFTTGIASALERSFRSLVAGAAPESVLGLAVLSDRRATGLHTAALVAEEVDPGTAGDSIQMLKLKTEPQRWVRRGPDPDPRMRGTRQDPVVGWGERFNHIGQLAARVDPGEAMAYRWRAVAYAQVVGALAKLHQRGWFERWPRALRLFELTDLELTWVDRRAWAPLMNIPETLQEYFSFFNFVGPCESALIREQ